MLVTPVSQWVKEKSGDKISSGLLRHKKHFGMEKVAGNIVLQNNAEFNYFAMCR